MTAIKPTVGNVVKSAVYPAIGSSSSYWTPLITNVVITPIAGGNRITFTPLTGYQTEIWYSLDGAAYAMLGRYAESVNSVDHTGLYANIVDYQLRGVLDDASYDSDAVALFNRMGGATLGEYPDDTRKGVLNTLFTTGKTKAFWSKLDAAWLIAAHGAGSAKLNIISTSFSLTLSEALTFEVDRGYSTVPGYIITGYNPTLHADNYSINSASLGVYCRTNTSGTGAMIGTGTAGNTSYVMWLSNNGYAAINGSAYVTTPTLNVQKLIVGRRLSNTTMAMFLNKVKDEEAKASAAIPNAVVNIGLNSDNQFAFAFIGGGMDDTDISDMYDVIVDGYLNSIGAKI